MTLKIHTKYPKYDGEKFVFLQLSNIGLINSHAFHLPFLQGVSDIDLLLWADRLGVFIIEIKGVPLEAVESFGPEICKISNRGGRSPQQQAYDGLESLMRFFNDNGIKESPFMVATVCWPNILRSEFNEKFPQSRQLAESMLFREDLTGSALVLTEKLKEIYKRPPIRRGAFSEFKIKPEVLNSFVNLIGTTEGLKRSAREKEVLKKLEDSLKSKDMRRFKHNSTLRHVFYGLPGTGKTFRLFQIAINHAIEGQKVLFCCYNTVLAADIKRLIQLTHIAREEANKISDFLPNITVTTISSLLKKVAKTLNVIEEIPPEEESQWASMIVEDLTNLMEMKTEFVWDTICIDEFQDLDINYTNLALGLARNNSDVLIGYGPMQEVYKQSNQSDKERFLRERNFEFEYLNDNYRNEKSVYEFAERYMEKKNLSSPELLAIPEELKIEKWKLDMSIPPEIRFLEKKGRVRKIKDEIANNITELATKGFGTEELLILTPFVIKSSRSTISDDIVAALEGLKTEKGIDYINYLDIKNRKFMPQNNQIRLVTYHSARGLESAHVLMFGIEDWEASSANNKNIAEFKNAVFIAMTRAIFSLKIYFFESSAVSRFFQSLRNET